MRVPFLQESIKSTSTGPGRLKGAACHGKSASMPHVCHLPLDPKAPQPLFLPLLHPLIMVCKTCPKPSN